ncbi:hypothetical protein ebA2504 [Aromatoleum aromaticum EbN1]|uniref:Uncharacterized protein n=1 Tax=Aromatoleum aromaticum (strain DSM 19018 / LMG 30748 / EbN1) TaxID=76114 RepID=Q5P577_AROAE|nr:hypothetical protein ebA2504 [Aromatoleum aromaticum EbN1]
MRQTRRSARMRGLREPRAVPHTEPPDPRSRAKQPLAGCLRSGQHAGADRWSLAPHGDRAERPTLLSLRFQGQGDRVRLDPRRTGPVVGSQQVRPHRDIEEDRTRQSTRRSGALMAANQADSQPSKKR